ncbi:MAG: hypothetical protein AAGG99_06960, partial [Pseudomonadota bacterium]
QKALDAAVVSVQRASPAPESTLEGLFAANFKANLPDGFDEITPQLVIDKNKNRVAASADTTVPTTLMALAGPSELKVAVKAAGRLNAISIRKAPKTKRAPPPRPKPQPPRAAPPQVDRMQITDAVRRAMNDPRITPAMRARLEQLMQRIR